MVALPDQELASIQLLAALIPDSDVDRLAVRLAAAIGAQLDVYRNVPPEELVESCRRHLTQTLGCLGAELPVVPSQVPAAVETGRRRVHQGLPRDALLGAYRVAGRFLWAEIVARAEQTALDPRVVLHASTAFWQMLDTYPTAAANAHRNEEASRPRRDSLCLDTVLDALLDGDGRDRVFAELAAVVLDTAPDASYVVVARASDGAGSRRPPGVLAGHGMTAHCRLRCGVEATVVELTTQTAQDVAHVLRAAHLGPAALSPLARGLGSVDWAFRLAEAALRTLTGRDDVALFADRSPEVLLLGVPEAADVVRREALGPLLSLPAAERRVLIATLRAALVEGKPTHVIARSMACHRNTILNRLERVAALTGGRLDDPKHRLRLHLAMLSHEMRRREVDGPLAR